MLQDAEREAAATLKDEHKKEVRGLKNTVKTQTEQIGKLQGDVQKYGHKRSAKIMEACTLIILEFEIMWSVLLCFYIGTASATMQ